MSGVISAVTYWMGKGAGGLCAGRYVKGHGSLRLATGARGIQAADNKAEPE